MKNDTKHLDDGGGFAGAPVGEPVLPCDEALGPYEYGVNLKVALTAEKLVKGFGDSAPDDVRTLIIELEQEVGLWALTILLGRYFEKEMRRAQEAAPELFNLTDDELLKELQESE